MPRTSSKLLIEESPLQVLPTLAVAIGLNEAIVLQQIHFLSKGRGGKTIDGEHYVYNSYTGWQKTFFPFWSVDTVQRTFDSLETLGILKQPANANSRAWRKFHRIDYSKIPQSAESLPQPAESSPEIPQNAVRTYIDKDIEPIDIGATAPRATATPSKVNEVTEATMTTPEGIAKADAVFLAFASKDHSEKSILRQRASDNAKALMSAFHQSTTLPWMKSWNSAANDMDGVGVIADDVREACRRLKQQRMTVGDLHSAKKTAIVVATERKAKSNGNGAGGQWIEENGVMVLYER